MGRRRYFRIAATGQVLSLSKSDFSVRALSFAAAAGTLGGWLELALSGSVLYWNWLRGAPYGIFSVHTDASGSATVDSSSDSEWHGPRAPCSKRRDP